MWKSSALRRLNWISWTGPKQTNPKPLVRNYSGLWFFKYSFIQIWQASVSRLEVLTGQFGGAAAESLFSLWVDHELVCLTAEVWTKLAPTEQRSSTQQLIYDRQGQLFSARPLMLLMVTCEQYLDFETTWSSFMIGCDCETSGETAWMTAVNSWAGLRPERDQKTDKKKRLGLGYRINQRWKTV